MLEKLKQKFRPSITDVDALVTQLQAKAAAADEVARQASENHTDILLNSGATAAQIEASRAAVDVADQRTRDIASSLRGAIERRDALAALDAASAASARRAVVKMKKDAALALADDCDRVAHALHTTVGKMADLRTELMNKRSALVTLLQMDLGGIPDFEGAACNVPSFDAMVKVDMGAMGLVAFGPAWTSPMADRPPTIAERITGGSEMIRALLAQRFPA